MTKIALLGWRIHDVARVYRFSRVTRRWYALPTDVGCAVARVRVVFHRTRRSPCGHTFTERWLKFDRLGPLFLRMEWQRNARVDSVAYDEPQCGWRVRLRVPGLWENHAWSTVRTEPPLDVRCTRLTGKFLELILFDEPNWRAGEQVTLTLEPDEPNEDLPSSQTFQGKHLPEGGERMAGGEYPPTQGHANPPGRKKNHRGRRILVEKGTEEKIRA